MSTTREKIKEAIESGHLLCAGCPKQGVEEGYKIDDFEVSHACFTCGLVEGHAMGTTDDLIEEIGEENLSYLLK